MKIEISGNDQQGRIGEPLAPLQIWLKEDDGERAISVPIRFRLIKGRGMFTHRDERTDWSGGAIAEFVPDSLGPYRIDCQINGRGQRVSFTGTVSAASEPRPTEAPAAPADQPKPQAKDVDSTIEELLNEADQILSQVRPAETASAAEAPATETAATTPAPVVSEPRPLAEPVPTAATPSANDVPPADQPKPPAPPLPETPKPKPIAARTRPLTKTLDLQDEVEPAPSRNPKITLAIMALVLALLIAGIAYLGRGNRTPNPGTVGSGNIDCTHAVVKVVDGDKFVFNNCAKQP